MLLLGHRFIRWACFLALFLIVVQLLLGIEWLWGDIQRYRTGDALDAIRGYRYSIWEILRDFSVVLSGILVLLLLLRIFISFKNDRIFDAVNIRRLRSVGWIYLGYAAVRIILLVIIITCVVRVSGTLPLLHRLAYGLAPVSGYVLYGLIVWVVAAVFREGLQLQEDQELTV
ncbi:DUF2975 domain-containing protein [Compostibacter hankyongensis]|uniref:DUF2975 domain-containing protein n=1 Tax=Compostibacter hankyongensis TaxID=1007089 RepID=A0ABP8FG76_9BACT